MANHVDFRLYKFEDGLLSIGLQPPTNVGGWNVQLEVTKRAGGGSGLITKSVGSGFSSGISVANSGQGVFTVTLNSAETSGMDEPPYAYTVRRLDSGFNTLLVDGAFLLL